MKKLVIVLVVLAALFGGYYFYWNKLANEAETRFLEQVKQNLSANENLKFDKITREGFPFSISLKLYNPSYEKQTEEENDSWLVKGTFSSSKSLVTGDHSSHLQGELTLNTTTGNGTDVELAWNGDMYTKTQDLEGDYKFIENAFDFIRGKDFKAFDLDAKNFKIVLKDLGNQGSETVIVAGPILAHVESKNRDPREFETDFDLNFKNVKLVDSPNQENSFLQKLFAFDDHVSSNFLIKGSLLMPLDEDGKLLEGDAVNKLNFIINEFVVDNSFSNLKIKDSHFNFFKNDNVDVDTKFELEVSHSSKWDEYLIKQLETMLTDPVYLKELAGNDPEKVEMLAKNKQNIIDIVPKLSTFGVMKEKWDLVAKVPQNVINKGAGAEHFIKLNDFEIDLKSYQTKLTGNIDLKDEESGKLVFSQTKYKALIHEVAEYYQKLSNLGNSMKITQLPEITDDQVNGLIDFLSKFDDHPNQDHEDLHITFTFNKEGYRIGTINFEDAMKEWFIFITGLSN